MLTATSAPTPDFDGTRVAVIGVGNRAYLGNQVALARPGAAIVAVVDPDPAGRKRAAHLFGDVPLYQNTGALIAAGGIDAAIVTTPDDTHAAIAIELLQAGIATFVDKPLAITVAQADAVLATAAAADTPLYIGHNLRHSAVVKTMRAIIERGEIGEVKAVWVRHFVGNGGDYFFKDWHADRSRVGSLLIQKASHDLDIIHYLAGGYSRRVVGMGELMIYGDLADRSEPTGQIATDWFSYDNWPPRSQTGLNQTVDVEDISMMLATLDNGVQASYAQCHFTPDYWRNYTIIGTEGRCENFGDTSGGVVRVWNRRHEWQLAGDVEYPIESDSGGHEEADLATLTEFFDQVIDGTPPLCSPIAARQAVAAGALAAESLRHGSRPYDIPELSEEIRAYFA
ncbi:MAG: Gfo/Idh/MocA family oxidoreductase [Promicromonosporaceae bacterium]|nr:Gfo/Idh/MocA family oxidoreductase [Promicromonosporaceae bacterium]